MQENISILKNRSVIKILGMDNENFLNNIFYLIHYEFILVIKLIKQNEYELNKK